MCVCVCVCELVFPTFINAIKCAENPQAAERSLLREAQIENSSFSHAKGANRRSNSLSSHVWCFWRQMSISEVSSPVRPFQLFVCVCDQIRCDICGPEPKNKQMIQSTICTIKITLCNSSLCVFLLLYKKEGRLPPHLHIIKVTFSLPCLFSPSLATEKREAFSTSLLASGLIKMQTIQIMTLVFWFILQHHQWCSCGQAVSLTDHIISLFLPPPGVQMM